MSRKLILIAVLTAAGLALAAPAQAQKAKGEKAEKPEMAAGGLYKCTDADGAITYTNVGSVKGCKKVEGEVNSVSVVKSVPAAPRAAGDSKVDSNSQKARDTDRRRILQEELAAEQKRLADLQKEYNNGEPERQGGERNYQKYLDRSQQLKDDVARSQSNVDSLNRELGSLKN